MNTAHTAFILVRKDTEININQASITCPYAAGMKLT